MLEQSAILRLEQGASRCDRRIPHNALVGELLSLVDLTEHRYLLVEDADGAILGVVEIEDLLQKVSSSDPVERQRWYDMPLEAAISARLDSYTCKSSGSKASSTICSMREIGATAVSTSDDELSALFLEDELFLRWTSVKQILQHALVDPVTELPNRTVFERRLSEEWLRLERNPGDLCVILIDLDYFKTVNDKHGHAVGDLVLKHIGRTLQHQLRSYDLLTRYGGDEFAAILTGCPVSQLSIPINRIQLGLQNLAIRGYENLPQFTLSIGAVTIHSQADVTSMEQLLKEADECLYQAKADGRGCAFYADLTQKNRSPQLLKDGQLHNHI